MLAAESNLVVGAIKTCSDAAEEFSTTPWRLGGTALTLLRCRDRRVLCETKAPYSSR